MHSVLVTGGAGFIGSNFIHFLLDVDPSVRVVNLDALTYAGSLENLAGLPDPERYTFVHGDITDCALVDALFSTHAIDTVVHFAAETHVDRSIHDPDRFVRTNILGTSTLLDAARQAWLGAAAPQIGSFRFHHVSTDEVYGTLGPADPAFTETTPYAPRSPYAASKAASDHLVRSYFITYGLPITITNCSNNYGPYQFPEKLIPLVILNALEGKPLPVYGDGRQIRDWLYVRDHAEAIYRVITAGVPGETYNVGGNNQPTNLEIVRHICTLLDELAPAPGGRPHAQLIRFVADRPGHDRRYDINAEKIGRELGWEPRESWQTGLRRTVTWILEHPGWVSTIRARGDYQGWIQANYNQRGEAK